MEELWKRKRKEQDIEQRRNYYGWGGKHTWCHFRVFCMSCVKDTGKNTILQFYSRQKILLHMHTYIHWTYKVLQTGVNHPVYDFSLVVTLPGICVNIISLTNCHTSFQLTISSSVLIRLLPMYGNIVLCDHHTWYPESQMGWICSAFMLQMASFFPPLDMLNGFVI